MQTLWSTLPEDVICSWFMGSGRVLHGRRTCKRLKSILSNCGTEQDPIYLRALWGLNPDPAMMNMSIYGSFKHTVVLLDPIQEVYIKEQFKDVMPRPRFVVEISSDEVRRMDGDEDPSKLVTLVDSWRDTKNKLPPVGVLQAVHVALRRRVLDMTVDDNATELPNIRSYVQRLLATERCLKAAFSLLHAFEIDIGGYSQSMRLVAAGAVAIMRYYGARAAGRHPQIRMRMRLTAVGHAKRVVSNVGRDELDPNVHDAMKMDMCRLLFEHGVMDALLGLPKESITTQDVVAGFVTTMLDSAPCYSIKEMAEKNVHLVLLEMRLSLRASDAVRSMIKYGLMDMPNGDEAYDTLLKAVRATLRDCDSKVTIFHHCGILKEMLKTCTDRFTDSIRRELVDALGVIISTTQVTPRNFGECIDRLARISVADQEHVRATIIEPLLIMAASEVHAEIKQALDCLRKITYCADILGIETSLAVMRLIVSDSVDADVHKKSMILMRDIMFMMDQNKDVPEIAFRNFMIDLYTHGFLDVLKTAMNVSSRAHCIYPAVLVLQFFIGCCDNSLFTKCTDSVEALLEIFMTTTDRCPTYLQCIGNRGSEMDFGAVNNVCYLMQLPLCLHENSPARSIDVWNILVKIGLIRRFVADIAVSGISELCGAMRYDMNNMKGKLNLQTCMLRDMADGFVPEALVRRWRLHQDADHARSVANILVIFTADEHTSLSLVRCHALECLKHYAHDPRFWLDQSFCRMAKYPGMHAALRAAVGNDIHLFPHTVAMLHEI
jgi:hypothetical protein